MSEPLIDPEHAFDAPQTVSFRSCWGEKRNGCARIVECADGVCFFGKKKERGAARRLTLGEVARRCLSRRAEVRNKVKTTQSWRRESGAGVGENKDGGTCRRRFA